MSPVTPPEVKDTGKRTKIFDWSVPIKVGTQPGAIDGELFWVPESSKAPAGAIVALVAIVVAGVLLVLVVRRRRRRRRTPAAGGGRRGRSRRGSERRGEQEWRASDAGRPALLASRASPIALRRGARRRARRRSPTPSCSAPRRPPGSTVAMQPAEVIFKFNQAVGGTLGAVRVYDAQGDEVDDLGVSHPEGQEHWMGVGLKAHLPDGTYTATYRVISADTHIVYGGMVFNIGHPGAAPRFTVAGLIGRNKSGEVTTIAFGVVRFLDYVSIALMMGGLAFLAARLAARPGGRRRRRAGLAGGLARVRPALADDLLLACGRARRARERARVPAAGRERRRRVAVEPR